MIFMTAILSLLFMRQDVCEAEHAYNHPVEFSMPDTATVEDLVLFLADYREPQYRALPGAGGTWWHLSYDEGTLARVCPDPLQISYANIDQHTPLKELRITRIYAVPAQQPAQ